MSLITACLVYKAEKLISSYKEGSLTSLKISIIFIRSSLFCFTKLVWDKKVLTPLKYLIIYVPHQRGTVTALSSYWPQQLANKHATNFYNLPYKTYVQ